MKLSTITLLNHQKLVAANNGGTAPVDLAPYGRQAKFILSAKSDAGTNPTLACKIQNSPPLATGERMDSAGTSDVASRTGTDTAIKLGASFTLADAHSLASVHLPLQKQGTVASGTITVAIYADSTGPTGSALASATYAAADCAVGDYEYVDFTFALPVDLAAGTYWIVLTSDVTLSATDNILWRGATVGSGGNFAQFDTAWTVTDTTDLDFYTKQYTFTDVTGLGFTTVTSTGCIQTKEINVDTLSVVRTYLAIGGTNTPAFYASVICLTPLEQAS